jgi:L-aminoadipate-semialdehyde dehydrogenase
MGASVRLTVADEVGGLLKALGVQLAQSSKGALPCRSPISGEIWGHVAETSAADATKAIARAHEAFLKWRNAPAPRRGELVRLLGEELRAHKAQLGRLISIEVGKIHSEGLGEVQEMIDICDFAVGQSRQLYGLSIATERPEHRMTESWHPLGVVGVISAFNFPAAVWSWNAALAFVCGDSVVWKPSEKTPLSAMASQALLERAMKRFGESGEPAPDGLSIAIQGGRAIGELLVDDPLVRLVSATGSTAMGRAVGPCVATRFGRCLLELGGNNAAIICPSADLDLALRACAFAAMGTVGQRCTTLRRMFVHESVYDTFVPRLKQAYRSVKIGHPLAEDTLLGPLVDEAAYQGMQRALGAAKELGGIVHGGERQLADSAPGAFYVQPALVEMPRQGGPMMHETFAPILYVVKYSDLNEALALHNGVTQGLSSAIFTTDLREAEMFLSGRGSDCGIANVNIGPSGAEIGGAFGGEKETGGGRESGSDAWRAYMRRATNTVNFGRTLPLAQGVKFDIAG